MKLWQKIALGVIGAGVAAGVMHKIGVVRWVWGRCPNCDALLVNIFLGKPKDGQSAGKCGNCGRELLLVRSDNGKWVYKLALQPPKA
jgi:hypothetical protein